jgi:signal transduction histidine kinase
MWISRFARLRRQAGAQDSSATAGGTSAIPKPPWIYRFTRFQVQVMVAGLGAAIFIVSLTVETVLYRLRLVNAVSLFAITDGVAAIIAMLFVLAIERHTYERRKAVHEQLRMVADLNHHIRNALDVIQMSAHGTKDAQAISMINEAATRIHWALKQILALDPQQVEGAQWFPAEKDDKNRLKFKGAK